MLIQLARRFGVAFVVPSIATRELADRDRYSTQEDASTAGLTDGERGHTSGNNPLSAASYSFVLFATGACIPLLPFLIASRASAVVASFTVSLLALFLIGLLTSFFNRRSLLFSGLRQVGIGAAAAALTYAIGRGTAAWMG